MPTDKQVAVEQRQELIERLLRTYPTFTSFALGNESGISRTLTASSAPIYVNPDGPEAADHLASLTAELAEMREAAEAGAEALDMMLTAWVEGREITDNDGRDATAAMMHLNRAILNETKAEAHGEGGER